VQIEVWSDVVCPWCAIGRARLQQALATFAHRDAVAVRWRSFELDPAAPAVEQGTYVDRLAGKYGVSEEQAQAMIDRVTTLAEGEGLTFRLDLAQPGNTFDAHRVLHLAADRDLQDAVNERLVTGYFSEGAAIGDPATLTGLATRAGLDESEVASVLDGDTYADAVRADERQAQAFGISGVPFFVIDRRYGIGGAQPTAVFEQALTQIWSDNAPPIQR
jgi:predicted DsbA family dithiol-disulfide isomerase